MAQCTPCLPCLVEPLRRSASASSLNGGNLRQICCFVFFFALFVWLCLLLLTYYRIFILDNLLILSTTKIPLIFFELHVIFYNSFFSHVHFQRYIPPRNARARSNCFLILTYNFNAMIDAIINGDTCNADSDKDVINKMKIILIIN